MCPCYHSIFYSNTGFTDLPTSLVGKFAQIKSENYFDVGAIPVLLLGIITDHGPHSANTLPGFPLATPRLSPLCIILIWYRYDMKYLHFIELI